MLKVIKKFLPPTLAAMFNSAKTEDLDKIDEDLNKKTEENE